MFLPISVSASEREYIYDSNGKVLNYKGSIEDIDIIMETLANNLGEEFYFKSNIDEDSLRRELYLNMSQELARHKYNIEIFDMEELFNMEKGLYMIRCGYVEQIEANKDLDKKITKIYKSLKLKEKTDIEKITIIHDYIIKNYSYGFVNYSIAESLETKLLKCDGYSALFQLLAEKAGLESIIVTAYVDYRDLLHTFNLVKINNKYYHVDTTYDATNYRKEKDYHIFLLIKKLEGYELGIKYQDLKLARTNYNK